MLQVYHTITTVITVALSCRHCHSHLDQSEEGSIDPGTPPGKSRVARVMMGIVMTVMPMAVIIVVMAVAMVPGPLCVELQRSVFSVTMKLGLSRINPTLH